MSQENVDLIRRVWEAWERRDTEAIFALYDPAITWENHHGPVELHTAYHGHQGVKQFWREWLGPFDSFRAQAEAFIDAGDKVVVRYRQFARGKTSGAKVELPAWNSYTVRDGLVTGVQVFGTEAEALEAVGLSEQDAPADSS